MESRAACTSDKTGGDLFSDLFTVAVAQVEKVLRGRMAQVKADKLGERLPRSHIICLQLFEDGRGLALESAFSLCWADSQILNSALLIL